MSLVIYPFVKGSGPLNMATDFWLFNKKELKNPIFRHYGWEKKEITFGYGQTWSWVKEQKQVDNLICTRRPTGGGIVTHGHDFTYTLIIPNHHESSKIASLDFYELIHVSIGKALNVQNIFTVLQPCLVNGKKTCGIPGDCFQEPVGRDLMHKGTKRKIAGAAMKKTKNGILIQGTVNVSFIGNFNQESFLQYFVKEIEEVICENSLLTEWPEKFDDEHGKFIRQFASADWREKRKPI